MEKVKEVCVRLFRAVDDCKRPVTQERQLFVVLCRGCYNIYDAVLVSYPPTCICPMSKFEKPNSISLCMTSTR